MKLLHISDLHLGKKLYEMPMEEEQKAILTQIVDVAVREKADGVLVCGDVFDKSVAGVEAVQMLDEFLVALSERKIAVYMIAGNHDSAERIAFGNRLMTGSGIFISDKFDGRPQSYSVKDAYGTLRIHLLPFVKPSRVRSVFPEEKVENESDAVRVTVKKMSIDAAERNILLTHLFVVGAKRSESEEVFAGGAEGVSADLFDGFDYVALGHIHGAQNIGSERIRYCGTPLKYSFSESKDEKSVTVIELKEKGTLSVRTVPLVPIHEVRELKGTYESLMNKSFYTGTTYTDDYLHITLTDEDIIPNALAKLRCVYKNVLRVEYDNTRTRTVAEYGEAVATEKMLPADVFSDFFRKQNGKSMTEEQKQAVTKAIEEIWEEK